ncbi:hypothetical protein M8494_15270 [Serratia ureilytica]
MNGFGRDGVQPRALNALARSQAVDFVAGGDEGAVLENIFKRDVPVKVATTSAIGRW